MGLIDQINRWMSRQRGPVPATTSDETPPGPRAGQAVYARFKVESDRRSVVEDCRAMYANDPRAAGFINSLARDAVKGGFAVQVKRAGDAAGAQQTATALIDRLRLFSRLDDWMRLTLRDGDSLLELAVDKAQLIQQVTRKPTLEMHRASNRVDRFDDPRRAYWWSDQPWLTAPDKDSVWFADWQIIHARWGHDEGSRYGRPLFAGSRKAWRRLDEGETDVAVRRKTRAGMKYVHKVEGGRDKVEEYMELNKATLDEPFAAIQDFFGEVEIAAIQGDARLGEISDVLHHLETFAIASPVPLALIGYGKELNRDILEQKLEQYERALEQVTQWVTDQLVKPLLETQWLLQGYWPETIDYEIRWASKKVLAPATLEAVAKAGLQLRALGWPDEVIVEILGPLVPGLDTERLLAALAAAAASQPDEIGRFG